MALALMGLLAIGWFVLGIGAGDVGSEDARRLVEDGARLVDVRTPGEFADSHIDGAVNIPVQELDRRMAELEPKDGPIVLYCRSGRRSSSAARMLKDAGYTAVHDLGPMWRW
jgi:phage shock protein E